MNVLVEITKQSIDTECELYDITEDKIEYCIENACSHDWVDAESNAIYTFDIWGNEPIAVWMGETSAEDVFEGWLPQIAKALTGKESAVTLWDMEWESIQYYEGDTDAELTASLIGVVDMDKIHLALEGNGTVIKSAAYVESLERELAQLHSLLTPEQQFDHAYGMLEAVTA